MSLSEILFGRGGGSCIVCGTSLAGHRIDASYCSAKCRQADHRLRVEAGTILPFGGPEAIEAPQSLERALSRFALSEQALEIARQTVIGIVEATGGERAGIFAGSLFVYRTSANLWKQEAYDAGFEAGRAEVSSRIETGAQPAPASEPRWVYGQGDPVMKAMRERDLSKPILVEEDNEEARDAAIVARWNAASTEERARMISATADRARAAMKKGTS